jgi:hypothetical protein
MDQSLSIWRFPVDRVGISGAAALVARQPLCSIGADTDFSAMTIYNYRQYIDQPRSPEDALAEMFSDMSAPPLPDGVGGSALFQQQSYTILAQSFSVPDQCNLVGTGGGGSWEGSLPNKQFYHFIIDFSEEAIFLNCVGTYTSGGKYFRSLAFKGGTLNTQHDTCIFAGTANCRAVNCTFTDIPTAFYAQGDGCALEQCTIHYSQGKNNGKAVVVAGSGCSIVGPGEIFQQGQPGGPGGCTGISIEGAAQHTVVANLHLSDWNVGIDFSFSSGAADTQITNCEMQCHQSALNIALPASPDAGIAGVKVTSCLLAKSNNSTATDPVASIDLNGNTDPSLLADITLLDCTVINFAANSSAQHGLQITGGSNIKIIGGTYCNNGSGGGAGIAITGNYCGDLQIIGANLQPSYPWASATDPASGNNQTYGLLVSGSPTTGTILVADCDLTGYSPAGNAVSVTGNPNRLLVYNCPGYNDQGTTISTVAPTSDTYAAKASLLGGASIDYFGPSVFFFFSNATAVQLHISGQTIQLTYGLIFLPSPYDGFHFTGSPSVFSWFGK